MLLPNVVIADTQDTFWYTGIDIGQGYYSNGGNAEANESIRHRLASGLHLGYQFNDYVSTELAYQYLGNAYANYNDGKIEAQFQQTALSARLGYPIARDFYPYIKLGAAAWHGETTGLNPVDTNGFSPLLGMGLSYLLTDNLSLRAEYQFTQSLGDTSTGYANHHLTTLGVSWRFGRTPKVAPIERVKLVEKVVETVIEKTIFVVSGFNSETLFEHNASKLINTRALQGPLQFLLQYPQTSITVTGHTDDTGSKKYNQWISEQRAQAVADYFIGQSVNSDRINIIGMGMSQPIADNNNDTGRAMNRRVEMTVQPFETTTSI